VADVTRRYNEMYGHHNTINGVYNGQQYGHHFGGISQVCDASTQSSSQLPSSSNMDGMCNKEFLQHTVGVKEDNEKMLLAKGETSDVGKQTEDLATNTKYLAIARELVDVLKKKLEGIEMVLKDLNECTILMLCIAHHCIFY